MTLNTLGYPAGARTTWAAAGGSTPSITCIDPFSLYTEADPTMGTGAVIDNTWRQIGSECFGHVRFKFGTGMSPGEGFYALSGLPATPKVTASSGDYARKLGEGHRHRHVGVVSRHPRVPVHRPERPRHAPVLLPPFGRVGDRGGQRRCEPDAAGGVGVADRGAQQPVHVLADGDIINVTFHYEAA